MTNTELFYKKLTQEYEDYMEEISEWDSEKIQYNAEFIVDYQKIYEYLMRDKPIRENSFLEHYMQMNKPLRTICEHFQEEKPPVYDLVNPVIWRIGAEKIFDTDFSKIKSEFLQRIEENYALKTPDENSDEYMMRDYVQHHIAKATDADIITLMQFQNPLKLLIESPKVEGMSEKISMTAHHVRYSDVLTMPYALDVDRLVPETIHRHGAINSLIHIIPQHDFNTTMQWLDFYRDMGDVCYETTWEKSNPYDSFIDAMCEISEQQGRDTVQQLYNMGCEKRILESELIEAAKYLAAGGNVAKVPKLAEYGYFDGPYEENDMSDDEFLEEHTEPNNGMTMM